MEEKGLEGDGIGMSVDAGRGRGTGEIDGVDGDVIGKVGGSGGIGRHRPEDVRIVIARTQIRGMVERTASRIR